MNYICNYCNDTGIHIEQDLDSQIEKKCICQVEGSPEYDKRMEVENDPHSRAGLAFGGYNEDDEIVWIGTEEQWKEYRKLEQSEADIDTSPDGDYNRG